MNEIGPDTASLARADPAFQTELDAFQLCTRTEGTIPALEPAHSLAHVTLLAPELGPEAVVLTNLCGRGDKGVLTVAQHLGVEL